MNVFQKELMGLQHKQQLLGILVFSLVTVVVWLSISLITSQTKTSISATQQKLAKALTPTLNTEVIDTIDQKRSYDSSELASFPIYKTVNQAKVSASTTAPSTGTSLGGLNQSSAASTSAELAPATTDTGTTTVTNSPTESTPATEAATTP